MHEPLGELDRLLFGKPWDFFQRGVREPYSDDGPFWGARSTLCELREGQPGCVTPPPLHMITGWHDFFAKQVRSRPPHTLPSRLRESRLGDACQEGARHEDARLAPAVRCSPR